VKIFGLGGWGERKSKKGKDPGVGILSLSVGKERNEQKQKDQE
jgi:hypothetical protein